MNFTEPSTYQLVYEVDGIVTYGEPFEVIKNSKSLAALAIDYAPLIICTAGAILLLMGNSQFHSFYWTIPAAVGVGLASWFSNYYHYDWVYIILVIIWIYMVQIFVAGKKNNKLFFFYNAKKQIMMEYTFQRFYRRPSLPWMKKHRKLKQKGFLSRWIGSSAHREESHSQRLQRGLTMNQLGFSAIQSGKTLYPH
mmetsp:Transcript_23746/g.26924  ORF Transcript_23746/g.26924 Transcript_23746/m.26924 type:complete len:195 (+) Transcript_23746:187-771(+)